MLITIVIVVIVEKRVTLVLHPFPCSLLCDRLLACPSLCLWSGEEAPLGVVVVHPALPHDLQLLPCTCSMWAVQRCCHCLPSWRSSPETTDCLRLSIRHGCVFDA